MKVALLLFRAFPARFALATLIGLVAGACGAALVATIARGASSNDSWIAWAFVFVALGRVVTTLLAQIQFFALANRVLVELRLRLAQSVLAAPAPLLESLGQGPLIGALTDDVQSVGASAGTLVSMLTAAGTTVGVFLYLMITAQLLSLAMAVLYALGFFVFTRIQKRGQAVMMSSGPFRGRMFGMLIGSVAGVKELKLHAARRKEFVGALEAALSAFHGRVHQSFSIFGWGESLQQASFFLIVAIVAVSAPYVIQDVDLSGVILGALYLAMPTALLVEGIGQLAQTSFIVDDLSALGLSLEKEAPAAAHPPAVTGTKTSFEKIELKSVVLKRGDFTLGPIDFTLRRGEIVFLVGGNGSGKTTLAKILLGLYPPTSGEVLLNDSSLFGALFADVHVFDRLYGTSASDEAGTKVLSELGLAHKVKLNKGRFSTIDLSQGQQKRLALASLIIESRDRPILLLDEWAAEQDPEFKRRFYTEILPNLRSQGKTLVVISHDDHYFHVADRIVFLEDGRIIHRKEKGSREHARPLVSSL